MQGDVRATFWNLSEAVVQGSLAIPTAGGSIPNFVTALFGAIESRQRTPDELAWELVRRSLARALAELNSELEMSRPIYAGDADALKARCEIALSAKDVRINHNFLECPASLPLLNAIRKHYRSWLRFVFDDRQEARERNIAASMAMSNRLDAYFTFCLHEEWRSCAGDYQPLFEFFSTPFVQAVQREWDWSWHQRSLIKQFAQPVFEESFSLDQVYVALRGYIRENKSSRFALGDAEQDNAAKLRVVDIRTEIDQWLSKSSPDDTLRLISGGPGSGKSSFAKKLAADLATDGQIRVLFIPLQRFAIDATLPDALNRYLQQTCEFTDSIQWPPMEGRVLLIFDGLDELTKPGDLTDLETQRFVQEAYTSLRQWNSDQCRMLILITGRTIVVQENRAALRLAPHQEIAVLPYLIDKQTKTEIQAREEASFADGSGILDEDQRHEWWRKYAKAKGWGDQSFPSAFEDQPDLRSLSREPILIYLIVLSRYHLSGDKFQNRNQIYAQLFENVIHRRHAQKSRQDRGAALSVVHDVDDDPALGELLETIATAAWYGDGRTATLSDVKGVCSEHLRPTLDRITQQELGFVRLLAAFHIQKTRQMRDDGVSAFEFTHRSFSEYLVARRIVREIEFLTQGTKSGFMTLQTALERWVHLFGGQVLSIEILTFIRDEMALLPDKIPEWFTGLNELLLRCNVSHFPMSAFGGLDNIRSALVRATNAEAAIIAIPNACARLVGGQEVGFVKTRWRTRHDLAWMLFRTRGQRRERIGKKAVLDSLGYLDMSEQVLCWQELIEADLRYANLEGAELHGARLDGAYLVGAVLRNANLTTANLRSAKLQNAILVGADLAGCNLEGADFRDANLQSCDFSNASLVNANLANANLEKANLSGADLSEAKLGGANLAGAVLNGAQLHEKWIQAFGLEGSGAVAIRSGSGLQ